MAEVWLARSRGAAGFEKTVVIKRVLPALMANPGFAELLVREAKIAARLSHSNIVQIFDLGQEQGAYFIAMEYVHGRDLGAIVNREQATAAAPLPLAARLFIIAEAAKALDYAHRRKGEDGRPLNIVHRDISPQNILVGFEGEVKVADFGIARADEEGLGRHEDPKLLRGKYAYMSPEQARGEALDRRSDLFSLAVVLHELITGRHLFRGHTAEDTLRRVREGEFQPPTLEGIDAPPELVRVLARGIALDRGDRYDNALDFSEDLSRLIFEMGAHPRAAELGDLLRDLFGERDIEHPNKLRIDLVRRAYDDAEGTARPGNDAGGTTESTRAFSASRRLRSEARRVVLLVVRSPSGPPPGGVGKSLEVVVAGYGGSIVFADGTRTMAAFGHGPGAEHAAEHALRAGLEVMRWWRVAGATAGDPRPAMVVLAGRALVFGDHEMEIEGAEGVLSRAETRLTSVDDGEIAYDEELLPELSRTFVLQPTRGPIGGGLVEGFRGRHERNAFALRGGAPLVGRDGVMRRISTALLDAAAGPGAAFVLVGPPGAGRSRILAEVRAGASPQNFAFVHAPIHAGEANQDFAALAALFADLLGIDADDTPRERHGKVERLRVLGLRADEVRVVGRLLGLDYPVADPVRSGRPRGLALALAARRALRALARDRVVVLAIDDVQWMDDASLQVLPLLIEGLAAGRVVVIMSARRGAPMPRLAVEEIAIERLDGAQTASLFAACVGARAVSPDLGLEVYRATGGTPSWIVGLSGAAVLGDAVAVVGDVASATELVEPVAIAGLRRLPPKGLPTAVQSWPMPVEEERKLVALVSALPVAERDLLRIAAAMCTPVDVELIAQIHGTAVADIDRPLRRLLRRQLLLPSVGTFAAPLGPGPWSARGQVGLEPLPAAVVLPEALACRAAVEELGEGERRRLHGRIAAVLERRGAATDPLGVEQLALHTVHSADPRRASEYLVLAAEQARARGEPARAGLQYLEAFDHIGKEPEAPPGRAADLLFEACQSILIAANGTLADRALVALVDWGRHADPGGGTRDGRSRGRSHTATEGSRGVAGDASGLRLSVCRARLLNMQERWSEAIDAVGGVAARVEAEEDDRRRGELLRHCASVALAAGEIPTALGLFAEARQALAVLDGTEPMGATLALSAVALARAGRIEDAESAVNQALAVAARLGEGALRYQALLAMAEVADARRDAANAMIRFREAADVAQELGLVADQGRAAVSGAVVALMAGDEAQAESFLDASRRIVRGRALRSVAALGAVVEFGLSALATSEGRARSLAEAERTLGDLEAWRSWHPACLAAALLFRVHTALGDPATAGAFRDRAIALADACGFQAMVVKLGS